MTNLDDMRALERLDEHKTGEKIAELPDQIDAAWRTFKQVTLPSHYIQAKNVLILGMGGSAIGGDLAIALAQAHATLPMQVQRNYGLPNYVNKDTLVIGVSYSGNTEETLDGFRQAASRGAKLIAITTGGEIGSLGRKFQIPIYSIDYGSQPRAAFGYLFTALVAIFSKLRFIQLGDHELEESAVLMRGLVSKLAPDVPTAENLAKTIATKLRDRIPLTIGAGAMSVVANRWKTQLNENAKIVAFAETMPEMCHNLIVGFEKVYKQQDILYPIFLESQFSHPRSQLRMNLINKQFTSARIQTEQVMIQPSGTQLSELLQMILLGDYVSYYTGLQVGADPDEIKAIIQLKKDLESVSWEPGR